MLLNLWAGQGPVERLNLWAGQGPVERLNLWAGQGPVERLNLWAGQGPVEQLCLAGARRGRARVSACCLEEHVGAQRVLVCVLRVHNRSARNADMRCVSITCPRDSCP